MSVLNPSGPLDNDEFGDTWFASPASPSGPGRGSEFFDEPRNRLLVAMAALVALGIVGILAINLFSSDGATQQLATPLLTADDVAGDEPSSLNASGPDGESLEPAAAADSADSSVAPSSSETSTTVAPTTAAPASTTSSLAVSTTTPTFTVAPTTAAPTTEPPTTAAPTTTPSTTAAPTTTTQPSTTAPTTAPPTTPAPTEPPGGGSVEQEILNLVNAERANAGCGALTLNGSLNSAADAHSEDMYVNDYFSHTGLDGSQPGDRARAAGYPSGFVGENIAAGYGSAESVMQGWMNSSGHRANILNCRYNHLGVGHSSQGNYWTQLFGGG